MEEKEIHKERENHEKESRKEVSISPAQIETQRVAVRVQQNLDLFSSGDLKLLDDRDFVCSLSRCFDRKSCSEPQLLSNILEGMLPLIFRGKFEVREKIIFVLFHASEFFLENHLSSGILCCNFFMREWLMEETEMLAGIEPVIRQFLRTIEELADGSNFEEVLTSIELLEDISSGRRKKTPALRSTVSYALKVLPGDSFCNKVFCNYPQVKEDKELIEAVVDYFGSACISALLIKMAGTVCRDERAALLEILYSYGDALVPALIHCLDGHPPWSVICAVLSIFGELGDDANYPQIEPFFSFPDMRVQQEALNAVTHLNEERRRERYLRALPLVNESLQLDLLGYLLELEKFDESFYNALQHIADKRNTFSFSRAVGLLSLIITGLKVYPREETIDLLSEMRRDYLWIIGGAQIIVLIDDALSTVSPQVRHSSNRADGEADALNVHANLVKQTLEEILEPMEERIHKYLEMGDERGAGKYIYKEAAAAIQQKKYDVADHLKNRLFEVDPFALDEVVKLGNSIDDQRIRAITPRQLGIWEKLSNALSTEEFNILYCNSSPESYSKGDILVKSGDMDRSLFLLNSGNVSLSYTSGGIEHFLRRVNPGVVLGGDHFFDASVWTVTLKALSPVEVQVVDQKAWTKIKNEVPQIFENLRSYCAKEINSSKIVTLSGDNRRAASRYAIHTQTRHQFLDPAGKYSRRTNRIFKGELLDLSRSGVAFSLKFVRRETSLEMLGRHIQTGFKMDHGFSADYPGIVVSVRLFDPLSQSYSVHIKFSREIDNDEFMEILHSNMIHS
ncbi:cyclic nucleotide-binding domain-containing protein [Desulforhopalus vacuolatus]|uniref:cyclic nucleotide-binding domain-containing protein n=1 Tax=Desulforhopalus vacuolatus TaxID=40414 RepID=UPI001965FA7C|nr:cyclic nucleotide-binding domain-containing protein [Desulforhopalus vacuolatus]MBM9520943.1 cyclic nucleotide-binding domain-containing protein [Desulforhopalus vacuolatus]